MLFWNIYLYSGLTLSIAYLLVALSRDLRIGPSWRSGYRLLSKETYLEAGALAVPGLNLALIGLWFLFRGVQHIQEFKKTWAVLVRNTFLKNK